MKEAKQAILGGEWPFSGDRRDWLEEKTDKEFVDFLEECWSEDPRDRPTSDEFVWEISDVAFDHSRAPSRKSWVKKYYPRRVAGRWDRWYN